MTWRALALTSLAVVTPAAANANPVIGPGVDTVDFGIYCQQHTVETAPAPETAEGVVNLVPEIPEFRYRQFVVPATIGIGFGVHVVPAPGRDYPFVTITVTHPPYPGSGIEVERWTTDFEADRVSFVGFSFDNEYELQPGEWSFTAETGDEELFRIDFQVVPELAMPGLALECMGGAVS